MHIPGVSRDEEGMKPCRERIGAAPAPFTPQSLAHGDRVEWLEVTVPWGRSRVVRFAGMEDARAWCGSPACQDIPGHRLSATENRA